MKKVLLVVAAAVTFVSAQTYTNDSLAVRAILAANGLSFLTVDNVTATSGSRIVRLNLSDLNLSSLTFPAATADLTALEWVNLDNNFMGSFPTGIEVLTWLDTLLFANNILGSVSSALGSLSSLKYLDLSTNQLSTLSSSIGGCTDLVGLRLNGNMLSSLPEELWSLTSLQYLDLSDNDLGTLSASLGNFTQLKKFLVSNSSLFALPDELSSCTVLEELNVNENALSAIDPVSSLTALTTLSCANNAITALPNLGGLTLLDYIDCSNNQIAAVPASIGSTALSRMNMSDNLITTLPDEINALAPVYLCDFAGNKLCSLSCEAKTWLDNFDYDWESSQDTSGCPTCTGIEQNAAAGKEGILVAPNPFNPAVVISIEKIFAGTGRDQSLHTIYIVIYDIHGRMITDLSNHVINGIVTWDASTQPAGVYVIRARINGKTHIARAMLVK
ncbi:MAG: hypothetical protein A2268_05840 [Candidatus Raymondbacteria bacterium RifOxyA12_full_50_37]|uniref:Secretion system C-terminal sorting domain-containing protein n=1 Tax=Candidatus Raymondbacteria bacterium RIFOXYD12_FULL_49_13 TaxID=1817890 RepID=A0A1F7FFQ9_UNCRA|nr:MAG: hypothetical protein A2268_05840 [Candidatus Raymondbacteria bacterium RifOxyA12_full_50_37]OGJ94263.1 MAG: hypothetical protein A2248_14770 [Candidatus Raymondbacteria bacterium RIFOXYA2_FULL_49_16]OGJ96376.1 MAG: hypothetical protein A2487_00370 [Candidatus Raymondbacteria bacterium RifOxyC12_full_50_8]OGJ99093.1 MAG: hypothetical protein A2453_11180 [Candidatus Raymondbacteria bacterium RIFOXYC2_FULL_50_21]OGK01191.1 MAG: hypothetical protein A2350_01660 [Candidatus Raymondbacteria b